MDDIKQESEPEPQDIDFDKLARELWAALKRIKRPATVRRWLVDWEEQEQERSQRNQQVFE